MLIKGVVHPVTCHEGKEGWVHNAMARQKSIRKIKIW
jgi:hypothetical protein